MPTVTGEDYLTLERAYDWFNEHLWEGKLPPCAITLQRHRTAYGYFHARKFASRDSGVADEIALNPDTFVARSVQEIFSTLVHEMVHLWQEHFGKPSRVSYHNAEWAREMVRIGLVPSDTGKPGGKQTGQKVSHYIERGGLFERTCVELLVQGYELVWYSQPDKPESTTKRSSKTKFTCPSCGQNAWAKPDANLLCGLCSTEDFLVEMIEAS
jgi:SprT-like family